MCKSVEIFCKKDGDAQHDEARTGREGHGRPQGGLSRCRKEELFHRLAIGTVRRQDSLPKQHCNLIFVVKMMDASLAAKPSNVCIWG